MVEVKWFEQIQPTLKQNLYSFIFEIFFGIRIFTRTTL